METLEAVFGQSDWTVSYITPMPQFGHCKTAFNQIIFSVLQPLVMMPLCAKELNRTTPTI